MGGLLQSGIIGPTPYQADGSKNEIRLGNQGDSIVSQLHGRYYETARLGNLFCASTPSVTAAASMVSPVGAGAVVFCALYNTPGSGKLLSILRAYTGENAAQTGLQTTVFNVIAAPAGITALGNITPVNAFGFKAVGSVARFYSNTALTGGAASILLRPLENPVGFSGAQYGTDFTEGSIVISPGACLIIAFSAAISSYFGGFLWEEILFGG